MAERKCRSNWLLGVDPRSNRRGRMTFLSEILLVCRCQCGSTDTIAPGCRRVAPRRRSRCRKFPLSYLAGIRRDDSQEPGLGVSRRCHSRPDAALRHAPAEPALHRCDARQAVSGGFLLPARRAFPPGGGVDPPCLVQRFRGSNHIRRPRLVCRTRCGRRDVG